MKNCKVLCINWRDQIRVLRPGTKHKLEQTNPLQMIAETVFHLHISYIFSQQKMVIAVNE